MKGLLTGYYGYKNLGDEILLFGVLYWIFQNYEIKSLAISVEDTERMKHWLEKNHDLLLSDVSNRIKFIGKFGIKDMIKSINNYDIKFFGGGEVLTENRPFPYDGYNMLIKNLLDIINGKFVLLGGIGTPKKLKTKALYKMILPRSEQIVVREKYSFDVAKKYNNNTILHNDFALDVVNKLLPVHSKPEKRVLINMNPYIYTEESISKIKEFAQKYSDYEIFYVPMDMSEDTKFYDDFKKIIPNLKYYDWTKYSVKGIIEFFATVEAGIGARLHFLLILHWLGKKVEPLAYQEKINKFFN